GIIIIIGCMHSFTIKHSSRFQNYTTLIKALFIVTLIFIGLVLPGQHINSINFNNTWKHELLKPGFAVSMVYVSFAYTGWNAAAYVAAEINKPLRNLPYALIASTLFVSLVYVLFQYALLKNASVQQLQNKEEVT
ncbi:amino acid permease, partial [Azoarcus indigens]|nr:amino acid permease [Azoarcus indigens]